MMQGVVVSEMKRENKRAWRDWEGTLEFVESSSRIEEAKGTAKDWIMLHPSPPRIHMLKP